MAALVAATAMTHAEQPCGAASRAGYPHDDEADRMRESGRRSLQDDSADCSWNSPSGFSAPPQYSPSEGPVYILPTVFHVVYDSNPLAGANEWYVPEATVAQAITNANLHMRNQLANPYHTLDRERAVDTRIELQLATNGVVYHDRPDWTTEAALQQVDDADRGSACAHFMCAAWDVGAYLNVFTYAVPGRAGYSYVASRHAGQFYDGIHIDHEDVLGSTFVHELGHYLDLKACEEATHHGMM